MTDLLVEGLKVATPRAEASGDPGEAEIAMQFLKRHRLRAALYRQDELEIAGAFAQRTPAAVVPRQRTVEFSSRQPVRSAAHV